MIVIQNRLEVLGSDRILVPGCEPTSALSSDTLMRFSSCGGATANLYEALEAIPGSKVEYQMNAGESNGVRKRWFVLPPYDPGCPCQAMFESFAILKELAKKDEEEDRPLEECQLLDQGFCPPKDFNQIPPPPVSPYEEEGSVLGINPAMLNAPVDFSAWSASRMEGPDLDAPGVG